MESKNIYEAINKVMQEVGYVQKTGKVQGYGANYSYAGEADLIQALRPAMVNHGIVMSVSRILEMSREDYLTKKGTRMNVTILTGEVEFAHASTNSNIKVMSVGEGADSGDKSANKAMTGMYKYALRQTFCIETGDDPDRTPSGEQERGSHQPSGNGRKVTKQAPAQTKPNGNGNKPAQTDKYVNKGEFIKAVMDAELYDNSKHAAGALQLLQPPHDWSNDNAVQLTKHYKSARDSGKNQQEARQLAVDAMLSENPNLQV